MTTPSLGVLLPRDLPADRVLEHARRAEALGFDELWVVEDLGFRGGAAQAAAVLAATERIHVGIGIVPAAARDVAFAAMDAATLARLFPGRVTFGIGHGMPDWMRSVGAWPARPLTYLEAYTRALRALLRGETVTTAPDAPVVLHGVALDPSSVPDVVPDVLLGVRGPRSLAVAGRVADGVVLAEPCAPAYVRAALAQLTPTQPTPTQPTPAPATGTPVTEWGPDGGATFRSAGSEAATTPATGTPVTEWGPDGGATFRSAGSEAATIPATGTPVTVQGPHGGATFRSAGVGGGVAGRPRVVTYDVAAVDDDEARALDVARPGLAWIGEPDWAPHVAPLPFAADLAALRARCASPDAFAAALPDAWVRELTLAGTPDGVRDRIAARGAAGATSCVLFPTGSDPVAALEALARVR